MGWFGSLDLAYKYAIVLGSLFILVILAGVCKVLYNKRRLKKYTKKAQLEAATGGQDERLELNKRELDEGDLFGIRAIQSGYFGGVAQSRPSSIAGDDVGEQSSASNTLLGSHPSPKGGATSPMSSVLTLPLEARHSSSPLRKTMVSTNDERPITGTRAKSTLQPSHAEMHGSINHDPAVNMYLNVPPSPTGVSRPSSSHSRSSSDGSPEEIPEHNPQSSYFPQQNPHYGGTYVPSSGPKLAVPNEVRDPSRPHSNAEYPEHEVHSQSASIVSRDSDATIRDNNRSLRSSIQEETQFATRPMNSRHFSYEMTPSIQEEEFPTRTPTGKRIASNVSRSSIQEESNFTAQPSRPTSSSRPYSARSSSYNNPYAQQQPDVPVPKIPQTTNPSATNDWGAAIFEDIDKSIQDNRSQSAYHTSHLSDSSSIYSSAQRYSVEPQNQQGMDPRAHFSRTSTGRGYPGQMASIAPSHELSQQSTTAPTVTVRRESDASTRQLSSGENSHNSSHRNTRELGDFYDSYWRQSQQMPSQQQQQVIGGGIRAEEKAKEGRRQNQLEINVPTIAEVPSPMATPVPSAGIGKAM